MTSLGCEAHAFPCLVGNPTSLHMESARYHQLQHMTGIHTQLLKAHDRYT